MRVGIDGRMVRISGIGRYTEELVCALNDLALNLTIIISPKDVTWWHKKHPQIRYLPAPEPIYSWSEQLIFPARLRRENFDLMHFTNFNVPLSWQKPFVMTVHDLTPLSFTGERRSGWVSRKAYAQVLRRALLHAGKVIVPSYLVKRQLTNWVETQKISVIPHALSNFFQKPAQIQSVETTLRAYNMRDPFICYVGNLRNHKNIGALLQAFAVLRDNFPEAKLVLIGPRQSNQARALHSLIRTLGLVPAVLHMTSMSDQKLRDFYAAARIFVLPSFMEGFGLVALEAAAQGTPVVSSNTTPVSEFLSRATLSFDPRKPDQLAKLLLLLWEKRALRLRLGLAGQRRALQRSWQDVAQETQQSYRNILEHSEV